MGDMQVSQPTHTNEIEKKLAWLENFVEELNDVVIKQGGVIRTLETEIKILNEKISSERENFPKFEKPPHY